MKKLLIAVLIIAIFTTLTGCFDAGVVNKDPKSDFITKSEVDLLVTITDKVTGCQYLAYGVSSQGKALTPRMDKSGKQICKDVSP